MFGIFCVAARTSKDVHMECLVGFRGAMACAEGSMRGLRSFSFIHSSWSSRRCGARQKETVTTKVHALVAVGVGGRCAGEVKCWAY